MINTAIIFSLLMSISAYGKLSEFSVQTTEIFVNGRQVPAAQRTFTIKPNESAVISKLIDAKGVTTLVEMSAADAADSKSKDAILMSFTVSQETNGTRKVMSSPKIVARSGSEAAISEGKAGDNNYLKISVIAKRL